MNIDLEIVNSLLSISFNKEPSLGLASGKMGGAVYFYCLGQKKSDDKYNKVAEKLLADVIINIKKIRNVDVKNGLGGIGLGLHYLLKNGYVKGNFDNDLSNIDNAIFRYFFCDKYSKEQDILSSIQLLFFVYMRLSELKKNKEEYHLFEKLSIQFVNNIYEKIDAPFFDEPLNYTVDYKLPQLLFVLSKLGGLGFYNYRIIKILEELSPKILATIPFLHGNRLYLWSTMKSITDYFNVEGWRGHIQLLQEKTKFDIIFNDELRSRNIYFSDGLGSIIYFLNNLRKTIPTQCINSYKKYIIQIIESSDVWELCKQPDYLNRHRGLFKGIPSAVLTLIATKRMQ